MRELLDRIAQRRDGRTVVVIDGGSGSGKTVLATRLADEIGAQLVGLDEFYPGWSGLRAASELTPDVITGDGFRCWNWARSEPGDWRVLDPDAALIIEGCGALTPASRALATVAVWCELDAATRKRRALARDGDMFAPHWDAWAAQEADHWARHRPWELADAVWRPVGTGDTDE